MTGGRVVSMHRRLIGLLAIVALVLAACSGGGAAVPAPRRRPPHRRAAPSARQPRRRRRRAEPVTITWYHIQNNDPGLSLWQDARRRVHGGAPERHDRHPGQRERGVQDQARRRCSSRATSPDLFQTWGGGGLRQQVEAGLVKDITRRHRDVEGHDQPRCPRHVRGRRQELRRAVRPRPRRLLVQHQVVRGGRDHGPAGDVGRVPDRPSRPSRTQGHHPDRPRRQGHVDRRLLLGVPRGPQLRPGRDGQGGHDR